MKMRFSTNEMLRGFERCILGAKQACVRSDYAPLIRAALFDGVGCEAWSPGGGRGALSRFPLGDGWGVVRRYKRGGAMRLLSRDAYLFGNRPLHELDILIRLHASGLLVPEPLGACWERRNGLLRGALATRWVDAGDLAHFAANQPAGTVEAAAREAGRAIRRLHDLGVFHADLNIRNILVGDAGVYLIDFDKARASAGLSPLQRARNLLRLRRSIEKLGIASSVFMAICGGYGAADFPPLLEWAYRAKGRLADTLSRRKTVKNVIL